MRIWHTALIDFLPLAQVKGQWSELNSIFKNQTNHGLINFVHEYRTVDLYIYTLRLIKRTTELGVNIKKYDHFNNYFAEFMQNINSAELDLTQNIFCDKMNTKYLIECLINLREKYSCNIVAEYEWLLIYNKFKVLLDKIAELELEEY